MTPFTWLLIGTFLGSVVTSPHDTREACEGRAVILREKGAFVRCVPPVPEGSPSWGAITPGNILH